jgi:hypothetical protein
VRSYWTVRDAQAAKQLAGGKPDAGSRGSVTGGGHLDGITDLLEDVFVAVGFDRLGRAGQRHLLDVLSPGPVVQPSSTIHRRPSSSPGRRRDGWRGRQSR